MILNGIAVFGTPEILLVCKDKRFIGEIPQDFCTDHNIILQTVIPGHHQSLGGDGTETRTFSRNYRSYNWKPQNQFFDTETMA